MNIRIFDEDDRKSVIELWEACDLTRPWNSPDKDIDRKIQFQPELFLVGTLDQKIIASAMAGYDGHRGSVFYLAVQPECQSKGYGQELMVYIESLLTKLGCPKLNIVVRTSNVKVLKFYGHLGYSPDDVASIGKRLIPDA
ncbi:GNAT family acetyltransferase [Pseudohongiella sp.]|uniref:N-acetyltransferase domain-containing protein n=1 Tax=marine sediment metagenome TaxID=412755 RepID=A0A0F9Z1I8_9ZZZZ|nr:GNAT family acetyltransferase [Pseudohongiella sp.]HDZ08261.1 GNAT family acetyltransferase [Pseudohongiella sp.]HEA62538.1 GNAT family acetyltransferase [Pseudohongiella sp.]